LSVRLATDRFESTQADNLLIVVVNTQRERFARIVQVHRRALIRYGLRRLDDQSDVEDLVAETFVIAWRRLDTAPGRDAELYWLYAIARRVLANQTRGKARSLRLGARLAAERELAEGEPRFGEEDLAALMRSLGRLSPEERELIELAYWERLTYREIGLVVGCNEKAAGARLTRVRSKLRDLVTTELASSSNSQEGSAER
jgi:RNA polymerase sigma factor (sigma-70 family)